MNTSRLSQGDMIAGIGGVVLFIGLFLNWILEASAWEVFDLTDILLAAIAVVVIVLVAAAAAGNDIGVPGGRGGAIKTLGFAATVICLVFLFEGEERGLGIFLSTLAALAIVYGGWQAQSGGPVGPTRATTASPGAPPAPWSRRG